MKFNFLEVRPEQPEESPDANRLPVFPSWFEEMPRADWAAGAGRLIMSERNRFSLSSSHYSSAVAYYLLTGYINQINESTSKSALQRPMKSARPNDKGELVSKERVLLFRGCGTFSIPSEWQLPAAVSEHSG